MTMANVCISFMSTATDAICCIIAKKDSLFGSQKIFSFCSVFTGFGGILGGLIGGYFTQSNIPNYLFLIYSILGLVVAYMGLLIDET